jgi:transposase InsO family protein
VLSDNGTGYRSHIFAAACRQAGLSHCRTRPYTPRTNGKAERFIQTLLREWAYGLAFHTSSAQTAVLGPLLQLAPPTQRLEATTPDQQSRLS